jgi:hypothetical protein
MDATTKADSIAKQQCSIATTILRDCVDRNGIWTTNMDEQRYAATIVVIVVVCTVVDLNAPVVSVMGWTSKVLHCSELLIFDLIANPIVSHLSASLNVVLSSFFCVECRVKLFFCNFATSIVIFFFS